MEKSEAFVSRHTAYNRKRPVVATRTTPATYAAWQAKAEASGLTLSVLFAEALDGLDVADAAAAYQAGYAGGFQAAEAWYLAYWLANDPASDPALALWSALDRAARQAVARELESFGAEPPS